MTSADGESSSSVHQAPVDNSADKKENGHHLNGVENGDANGAQQEPNGLEKHRHSGHHSSSSSKDKDRHKSRHSSSHHSSSKDKHRSSHHSSSSKDRPRDDKDRHKDRHKSDKDKHRDKDRHRSDKDKHRSDKDKHRSDKDKHRSSSDKKHSSSSSKDKDRHSSSHKDRHSSHKSSSSSHREERREPEVHTNGSTVENRMEVDGGFAAPQPDFFQNPVKMESEDAPVSDYSNRNAMTVVSERVKSEDESADESKLYVKDEGSEAEDAEASEPETKMQIHSQPVEDSSDDEPLAVKLAKAKQATGMKESGDDSDDEPLAVKLAKAKTKKPKKAATKKRKKADVKPSQESTADSDWSDGDGPKRKSLKSSSEVDKMADTTGYHSYGSDCSIDTGDGALPRVPKGMKDESDDDSADSSTEKKRPVKPAAKKVKKEPANGDASPKKRVKKQEDEEEVWKWWEEEKKPDGVKWNTLEHKGPVFAPDYEPLPSRVNFYYNGKRMQLSPETEEVATFYGRMLDHDYTQKDVFNKNFFHDWRKVMNVEEKGIITDLKKCNFSEICTYFKEKTEERKGRSKEEKQEEKKKNEEMQKEFGFCLIDGHKQKIGNFKIEPPGLFRGRGEHPKMGKLKKRTQPEDVIINIGKGVAPPKAPVGHKWKEVRHDNTVTWLCCWTENVLGNNKYIMLNPASKIKGEKDFQKYETARRLKSCVKSIRETYQSDWKSKEMRVRQRAVALYFIDKLALRAGNEKDSDEQADTVGCCSLRVEHIRLHDTWEDKESVVEFDFPGKDSIRYQNWVPVEKRVYKNLKLFCENKKPGDDLFDRLNTTILNKHLNELMEGLTAKVFRTYNASKTLQEQLNSFTEEEMTLPEKLLAYNRANRAVAVLCNHQRAVPKTFEKSMENLQKKIDEKQDQIADVKREYREAKRSNDKATADKKQKRLQALEDQLKRLHVQATDREENKQIALGTSKLNYLDPRISVAWCKKWDVPIDKVYNKTQRDKFRWAIEMVDADYKF